MIYRISKVKTVAGFSCFVIFIIFLNESNFKIIEIENGQYKSRIYIAQEKNNENINYGSPVLKTYPLSVQDEGFSPELDGLSGKYTGVKGKSFIDLLINQKNNENKKSVKPLGNNILQHREGVRPIYSEQNSTKSSRNKSPEFKYTSPSRRKNISKRHTESNNHIDHSPNDFVAANNNYDFTPTPSSDVISKRFGFAPDDNNSEDEFWGSHRLSWPLETFLETFPNNIRWIAYFHDQAIAIVLQRPDGKMYNCTLLEVIPEMQQTAVLQRLGTYMPLIPIGLNKMINLISLCGNVKHINDHPPKYGYLPPPQEPSKVVLPQEVIFTAFQGILPGTLWCGSGDVATVYEDLGHHKGLDGCCRAHDHCPVKLRPFTTRYGITNQAISSRSHCACDWDFYRCLKAVEGEPLAETVGLLYYNILQIECLENIINEQSSSYNAPGSRGLYPIVNNENKDINVKDLDCVKKDQQGYCRLWIRNPNGYSPKLAIVNPQLRF